MIVWTIKQVGNDKMVQFNQILNIFELTEFAIKLDARACENERN